MAQTHERLNPSEQLFDLSAESRSNVMLTDCPRLRSKASKVLPLPPHADLVPDLVLAGTGSSGLIRLRFRVQPCRRGLERPREAAAERALVGARLGPARLISSCLQTRRRRWCRGSNASIERSLEDSPPPASGLMYGATEGCRSIDSDARSCMPIPAAIRQAG